MLFLLSFSQSGISFSFKLWKLPCLPTPPTNFEAPAIDSKLTTCAPFSFSNCKDSSKDLEAKAVLYVDKRSASKHS